MKQNNHQQQRKIQSIQVKLLRLLVAGPGKWIPSLASYWAYHFWTSTFRFTEPARETVWREKSARSFINLNDQRICIYQWGQGPVILLVHGWNGRATQMAAFAEPLVSAGYKVIGFDAPAHGCSDGKQTNILEVCDVMTNLSESFGPVHGIIAHSFGVPCSVLALNENWINANKIVCISSPVSVNWLLEMYCQILGCPAVVKKSIKRRIENQFGETIWQRLQTDQMAKSLACPALIIHDQDDHEIPWEHGQELSKLWPDSNFLLTKNLGHRRILHNKHVIQQVVDFFDTGDEA